MSLYEDLNEVLTPYANKINNLNTSLNIISEEVDTLNNGGLDLKDEVIQADVEAWLADHPEATTTVQDGAVTTAKIASGAVTYEKLDSELRDSYKSTLINLLDTTLPSIDRNGLTYTRSEDGIYTITGMAEQNTYLALGMIVLPAGTYKFVGLTSSGSSSTFKVNLYGYETSAVIATDIGNGCEFELSTETTVRVVPYIYSGTNVNITIKPFISTSCEITVDDYVPYLYDETDLNKNVALLKNDLSSYKLGGERIKNNNVGWMYDVAKSWIDNASSIYYRNENNLFWDDIVMSEDNRYPMSCSVFAMAFAFGISFYDSRYNGLSENTANGLAYTDDTLLESLKNGFNSASILKYFLEKGYAYYPTDDMSNVQTGDILFYDLNTSNDSATGYFMGIDHSSVFAYFSPTNSAKYYVWEVGGDAGPVLSQKTVNPDTLIIAVRLPYRGMLKNSKSVTLSGDNFASPVLLSGAINLSNNGVQGMWKIVLSGSAYSRGASASSVYLVRANSSGIPTDVVALYEGNYSAVRKISYISGDAELNDGYYIIDASESYDQSVTIHAEFICA